MKSTVASVRQHMPFKVVRQLRRSTVRRMLLRPMFPLELELHRLDCLGSHGRLDHYEFPVAQQKESESLPALRPLLIRAEDLLALGLEPGPRLGRLLDAVLPAQALQISACAPMKKSGSGGFGAAVAPEPRRAVM